MKKLHFPDWEEVLEQGELPRRLKISFRITIRWYLSFCRRARAEVHFESARDFIAWAAGEKRPTDWQLEQWKEALRWFFRTARKAENGPTQDGTKGAPGGLRPVGCKGTAVGDGTRTNDGPVWLPPEAEQWPEWKRAFLTKVRVRHYSRRTEQSYQIWIEQFARHFRRNDLEALGESEIQQFLEALALEKRLSASSQRQALNSLVFLYREVFGRELGDFSNYRRARARTTLPVWLTKEEVQRLFEALDEPPMVLMAQVMYGSGLRLMELLRLRVKDIDLAQEIITVRGGKGDKDRFAPLAHSLVELVRRHLAEVRQLYDADRAVDIPGVALPDSLERKYPRAGKEGPESHLTNAHLLRV
jgi:integrase